LIPTNFNNVAVQNT